MTQFRAMKNYSLVCQLLAHLMMTTLAVLLCVGWASAQAAPLEGTVPESQATAGGDISPKVLARQARDSVVLLRTWSATGSELGTGTAFFVGPTTLATNHHVIGGAARVVAVLADGRELPVAGLLAQDRFHDLALLHVTAEHGGVGSALALYRGGLAEAGEDVVVLGNPAGLSGTLSTGIVSAVRVDGIDGGQLPGPLLQITAPISPGSSGSPVMNLRGEVIGVAVAVYSTGQNLNFAVPVSRLEALIGQAAGQLTVPFSGRLAPAKVALGRNLLISALVLGLLIVGLRRLR